MSRSRTFAGRGAVVATVLAVGAGLIGPTGASAGADPDRAPGQPQLTQSTRPAGADALRYRSKRDARGDVKYPRRNRPIDIARMQAWPHTSNKPRYAAVRIKGYDFPRVSSKRNLADVFLNLKGTDRKPDFRVVKYLPRDGDGLGGARLLRVRGWQQTVRAKRCQDLVVNFNAGLDRVTFFIPRGCINARGGRKFQVHVRVWNVFRYSDSGQPMRGWFDEVPNRQRRAEPRFLSGWV
jgi:hypothetical protein